MFPKAEESDIDWEGLEAAMLKRKEQLMAKSSAHHKTGNGRSSKAKNGGAKNGRPAAKTHPR